METVELPVLPGAESLLAGRYVLGDAVGVGGFALVYRAEDRHTGRPVAVKVYPPGAAEPDRVRQRTEFGLLTRLRHPHLVELLDAGEDAGRVYLVMPLVDGPTLEELLRDGPMPPAEVARLGAALADAFAHVHRSGVIHRDVKPANVLMGRRPLLTDFGIARLLDSARLTRSGWVIGTPAYLAPEQLRGDDVGPPADVYALGLVLVEALTGRPREVSDPEPGAAFDRLAQPPAVPPGLPGLTDTLLAMTHPGPARRPTAARVAEDLRRAAPELESRTPLVDEPARPGPVAASAGGGGLARAARSGGSVRSAGDWRAGARRLALAVRNRRWVPSVTVGGRRWILVAALAVLATGALVLGLRTASGPAAVPPGVSSASDVAPQPARPLPPAPAYSGDEGGSARSDGSERDSAGGDSDRSRSGSSRGDSDSDADRDSGGNSDRGSSGGSGGGGSSDDGGSSDEG